MRNNLGILEIKMRKIKDKNFEPYISETEILKRIEKLAKKINEDYAGQSPIFIVVLNGAFMFASDLLKEINLDARISFLKLASYQGTKSTGKIENLIGLNENLQNQEIIILEDIVDTGQTVSYLYDLILPHKPKSLKIASLLLKSEIYQNKYPIDYIGFDVPNLFFVGYGLDYDGFGRNLKSIYHLKK